MANNNKANADRALATVDMGDLKVEYKVGSNPKQVTRIFVWDNRGKQVVDKSVSSLSRQDVFEDLLKEIRDEFASDNSFEDEFTGELDLDLEVWDEEWHLKSLEIEKSDMIERIENGANITNVIEKYLEFYSLTDVSLCEQWNDLKLLHKVIRLSNGNYYTDDQLKMVQEVMSMYS